MIDRYTKTVLRFANSSATGARRSRASSVCPDCAIAVPCSSPRVAPTSLPSAVLCGSWGGTINSIPTGYRAPRSWPMRARMSASSWPRITGELP